MCTGCNKHNCTSRAHNVIERSGNSRKLSRCVLISCAPSSPDPLPDPLLTPSSPPHVMYNTP
eukprot:1196097-Prorocentrum_minimum.AAC.3